MSRDDVVQWAVNHYQPWSSSLAASERSAIHYYQLDEGAAELNAWFRRGVSPSDVVRAEHVSRDLDAIVARMLVKRELVVYRGAGPRDTTRFPDELMEMLASSGGSIEDRGYLSTSLDLNVSIRDFATSGGTIYEILVPATAEAAFVGHPSVSRPERVYQHELLFPRGRLMRVVGVQYGVSNVRRWIKVEMI